MTCARVLIDRPPFADRPAIDEQIPWIAMDAWPCRWISRETSAPAIIAYRCPFDLATAGTFRWHVTADESYELYLDGEWVGSGPDRGDRGRWFFDSYDVQLGAGRHVVAALVRQLGERRPAGVVSIAHGLLLAPEDAASLARVGTGVAPWETAVVEAVSFSDLAGGHDDVFLVGPGYRTDLRRLSVDWSRDESLSWGPVVAREAGNHGVILNPDAKTHLLRPAFLPAQRQALFTGWTARRMVPAGGPVSLPEWSSLLASGETVTFPPHTGCEVILDAGDYLCGQTELEISGGRDASLELGWAEVIRDADGRKRRRDTVEGEFRGQVDTVIADGSRRQVRLPVWRSGRFLQVKVTTQLEPLTIHRLSVFETGYPINPVAQWQTGDPGLDEVLLACQRTQQACAHDTYMDCPFYEQLQYIGDTRIQALVTYCLTPDARLVANAIDQFLSSRVNPSLLPLACAPTDGSSVIPPFSLWLIGLVRDYAWWRGDDERVRAWLPPLRAVLDHFLAAISSDGLMPSLFGWNFIDGALGQIAPGGMPGQVSGLMNWQLVLALTEMADLEAALGEPELAQRFRRRAHELSAVLDRTFYRPDRQLYADVPELDRFSEHGQILPLLTGTLSAERTRQVAAGLQANDGKQAAGAYFQFYLFEVFQKLGQGHLLLDRLGPWRWALAQGFKTFPEYISLDTRSDCHAWSAHPLYHWFATILGIRPAACGFRRVHIAPQPGPLTNIGGTMAHPGGLIRLKLEQANDDFVAEIELPPGLSGEFAFRGREWKLSPGSQRISKADA